MLNEFTVGSYRGLQNLELKDLRKVNIIAEGVTVFIIGGNSGKIYAI